MPIPAFVDGYFLPPGVHTCTLDEVAERFGRSSPSREKAWERFEFCLGRMCGLGLWPDSIVIDGSFVTGRIETGDVDAVALVPPITAREALNRATSDHDRTAISVFIQTANPNQNYNTGNLVRALFGTHIFVVPDTQSLRLWERFFSHITVDNSRDPANTLCQLPREKGILKIDSQGVHIRAT